MIKLSIKLPDDVIELVVEDGPKDWSTKYLKEFNKRSCVYYIYNHLRSFGYVGSSKSSGRRWQGHRNKLRKGCHENSKLQNAWNKYGELAFNVYVMEFCMEEERIDKENWWIKKTKSYPHGYNLVPIATPVFMYEWTKERREAQGSRIREYHRLHPKIKKIYVKKPVEEVRKARSEWMRIVSKLPQTIDALTRRNKKRKEEGVVLTPEQHVKQSELIIKLNRERYIERVSRIPIEYKSLILGWYHVGMSYERISKQLNVINVPSVQNSGRKWVGVDVNKVIQYWVDEVNYKLFGRDKISKILTSENEGIDKAEVTRIRNKKEWEDGGSFREREKENFIKILPYKDIILEMRNSGASLPKIAEKLNEIGSTSFLGCKWSRYSVSGAINKFLGIQ